jgi:hypothetical protein
MPRSCRWTPLGPIGLITNTDNPGSMLMSGRVTALAVDPSESRTVYAGTANGSVWKTTDRGERWRPLFDRGPSLAIGAIAIDASNPSRVFVGTGEGNDTIMAFNGVGLLLTEDGGTGWRRVALPALRTTRIVVSPSGNRVFLASTRGLWEYRRENDGPGTYAENTWTSILDAKWVSDLAYDDVQDRVYAALRGDGVYARDGGGPFVRLGRKGVAASPLPDADDLPSARTRIALAWIRADPGKIFAAYATQGSLHAIFRSDDSGGNWSAVVPPGRDPKGPFANEAQGFYNLAFARNPNHPTDLYLGMKGFWRSTDLAQTPFTPHMLPPEDEGTAQGGGDTGAPAKGVVDLHVDQHVLTFPSSGDDVWLGNDGGVWLSTDRADSWKHRNRGLAAMQFYGGAHHEAIAALLLGGSQDNNAQFHDGHPLWKSSAGGDVADVALDATNRRAWITTNFGEVQLSKRLDERDGAFLPSRPKDPSGSFFARIALAPSDPSVVYMGTGRIGVGVLSRMDARVGFWTDIPEYNQFGGAPVQALAVAWDDPRLVFVADEFSVYRVEFASPASTVTVLPMFPAPPGNVAGPIEELAVSPRDHMRIYVAIGELEAEDVRSPKSRLFRFDGAANQWTDLTAQLAPLVVDGSPFDPRVNAVHAVVVDPDPAVTDPTRERVYIGCDRGVFESRDGGDSWRPIDHGLPLTPVYDLRFHAGGRLLRAFTHGRGAWERSADVEPCTSLPGPTEVDLVLRDMRYDSGTAKTDLLLVDPVRRDDGGLQDKSERRIRLHWTDAPDIKVDRESIAGEEDEEEDEQGASGFQAPSSTVDYTPSGALDCVGFEGLEHREPRRGAKARLHLQIHNRGPDAATGVIARIFFAAANEDKSWPDLPADFWTVFPAGNPAAGSPWKPMGSAKTIAEIRPAEPEVVSWDWDVPNDLGDIIGILAIVTSADDPVFEGVSPSTMPLAVADLVRQNKRISLKQSKVIAAAGTNVWHKIIKVLEYAGIAVAAGAAVYGLYKGGEYVSKNV